LASAFRGSHSNTYLVYTECRTDRERGLAVARTGREARPVIPWRTDTDAIGNPLRSQKFHLLVCERSFGVPGSPAAAVSHPADCRPSKRTAVITSRASPEWSTVPFASALQGSF
jgi:hypothetical protein